MTYSRTVRDRRKDTIIHFASIGTKEISKLEKIECDIYILSAVFKRLDDANEYDMLLNVFIWWFDESNPYAYIDGKYTTFVIVEERKSMLPLAYNNVLLPVDKNGKTTPELLGLFFDFIFDVDLDKLKNS